MSSTDPIMNNGEGASTKFADSDAGQNTPAAAGGFVAQTRMAVVPPSEEDLQKSYAKVVGSEANPKGWYGSMSTSPFPPMSSFRQSILTSFI